MWENDAEVEGKHIYSMGFELLSESRSIIK